jgi:hypothetical protein
MGKYSINSQMTFNLSVRQYWSYAEKKLLSLDQDGGLPISFPITKTATLVSILGILIYLIIGGLPGSQVSILYRNNAANFEREINKDLSTNITDLLNNAALNHTFSISVRYFIDYNSKSKS